MRTNNTGFTLVELILSILIITILAVYFSPNLIQEKIFENRFFLDEALSSVRLAKQLATASGCDVEISMSKLGPKPGVISLHQRANCETGDFNINIRNSGTILNSNSENDSYQILAPKGVNISSNDLPIYFNLNGKVFDHADKPIISAIINIGSRNIFIQGQTGFAYVPEL